jgi:hypothetical protein
MKTNKLILMLSMMLIFACSFAGKPPVSVLKAFAKRFPGKKEVTWIKESSTKWEAYFSVNGTTRYVDFSVDGKWVETEIRIEETELPSAAVKSLDSEFAEWLVVDAYRIENHKHGVVYAVDLKRGIQLMVVAYDQEGKKLDKSM